MISYNTDNGQLEFMCKSSLHVHKKKTRQVGITTLNYLHKIFVSFHIKGADELKFEWAWQGVADVPCADGPTRVRAGAVTRACNDSRLLIQYHITTCNQKKDNGNQGNINCRAMNRTHRNYEITTGSLQQHPTQSISSLLRYTKSKIAVCYSTCVNLTLLRTT